jgi:hypothetical protein
MKILCEEQERVRPPKDEVRVLKEKLTKFYKKHYEPLTKKETFTK